MVRPCHSTFFPCCFPKLFSVLGSAIYHSSAWQVSYIKYFMAWWSFSTSVTVPPESDISWSLNVFHTILMLHHGYLTMDKTGHNIMLLDMNLCIYSFKIVLKYIQAWKFRSCSPSENPCPWWKVHLFQSKMYLHLTPEPQTSYKSGDHPCGDLDVRNMYSRKSLKAFSWFDWRIISIFIRSWHVS